MKPLYPEPLIVTLDTTRGYSVNPVTGDSVPTIVNSSGHVLKTGVPVPIEGKKVDPGEMMPPIVVKALDPVSVTAYQNEHDFQQTYTTRSVDTGSLKTITAGKNPVASVLINSTGDTVPTGIPVPVKGRVLQYRHPVPVIAQLPRAKDDALKNIKYLDVDQGLKSSVIMAICGDRQGNICLGTYGAGLCMFNGITFKHFSIKEGLASNDVNCILEDSRGNLWFGTNGGLHMYDGDSIFLFTENEGLGRNVISSLIEDSHGNIWIGTSGGGITRFDGTTFTTFTQNEGLSHNNVNKTLEDRKGNLWIITWGGGINRYDGETFMHFTENDGLLSNYLISISEDNQGNLWFGFTNGLMIYDGESFSYITEKEGLSSHYIMCAFKDSQGNLWFGTNGGGVNKFDGKKVEHFTEREGLSSNFIHSIFEDSYGNIWVGTNGAGVSIISGSGNITHFTDKEGLSNTVVFSMLEDSKGNLWFGTRGGGVNQYDGKTFRQFTRDAGLGNNYVLSIMEDSKGNMWFGTYGNGVSKYDGKNFVIANSYHGLSDYTVNCMLEDRQGDYWFGTYRGGLTRFDGQDFFHYTEQQGLGDNFIASILQDDQGYLWFATNAGISRYRNDTITHFTEKEGLLDNNCKAMMIDRPGNIWIGTRKGLSIFTGEAFINYTENEGLCNNNINTITEYERNEIWVSTINGLNRFVFESDDGFNLKNQSLVSMPLLISYGKQDGLKGINFYHNSVIDRKHRIWYGTGKNLTMLELESLAVTLKPPIVQLNRIDIKEQALDYRTTDDSFGLRMTYSSVAGFNNYPVDLEVPHRHNHLTFYYSGIDWSAPHKIRYSYKINGVDDNWSTPSSEAKADYRNLPHGTHTFKVCAIGEAQKWSEPLEYTFTVSPPWYHTWVARISYGLLAFILVFGFVRWRTAKLKYQQKELETKIKNATREIRDKKDEVEAQRDEIVEHRNQLQKQRDLVFAQKQEITDSINYAQRIQNAALPNPKQLDACLPEYFVLFKPRDIVSGDFYWIKQIKNFLIIVVADCTGHGVPGAFMSMLGISILNEQVGRSRFDKPGEILDRLRKKVKSTLSQEGRFQEQKDGMDMALIIFDQESRELQYAGAFNPLYVIRSKEKLDEEPIREYASLDTEEHQLFELKGDRQPIAIFDMEKEFTTRQIQLISGDSLYLFSDGFPDQIGGANGKKFLIKNFKRLLLSMQNLSMSEQLDSLEKTLKEWKSGYEQVDDILVMGIKI
jgi:ligand-binding sensor domain-containing protein/serine phosphatase RsbU (regulator of sigma subunit)